MTSFSGPVHSQHPGLTVGQVASKLKICPSTARRWVRSGRLPVSEPQADQLVSQAETIGRQGAKLERAAPTIFTLNASLEARTAAESATASSAAGALPRLWRRLVRVLVVAVTTMVTLLAWPG